MDYKILCIELYINIFICQFFVAFYFKTCVLKFFNIFSNEFISNGKIFELSTSLNFLLISIWIVGILHSLDMNVETVVSLLAEKIVIQEQDERTFNNKFQINNVILYGF